MTDPKYRVRVTKKKPKPASTSTEKTNTKPKPASTENKKTPSKKTSTRKVIPLSQRANAKVRTRDSRRKLSLDMYEFDKFISDIFLVIKSRSECQDKIDLLHKYKHEKALRTIIVAGYDKSLEPDVDCNVLKLTNQNVKRHVNHTYLYDEYVNLYKFYKGGADNIPNDQKVILFSKFMNRLHPDESELLTIIFQKRMYTHYRLSYKIVEEVFPEIVFGGRGPSDIPEVPKRKTSNLGRTEVPLANYLGL